MKSPAPQSDRSQQEPTAVAALAERVKELTCLYEVAAVFAERRGTLRERLARVVAVLPGACRFPERAAAQLRLDDIEVASQGTPLEPSTRHLRVALRVAGAERGEVVRGGAHGVGVGVHAAGDGGAGLLAGALWYHDGMAGLIFLKGVKSVNRCSI